MAEDPEHLVLSLLREIREDVRDLKTGQKDLSAAVNDLRESMPYALGLAAQANVRTETVAKQIEELREPIERLEEKV